MNIYVIKPDCIVIVKYGFIIEKHKLFTNKKI